MIPRTKVFVGSLPPGSKPEELRRLFENYGVVTECDIMNRCGFVHMETQDMAENAIKALNNTNFKGSTIAVEPGRMKDRKPGGDRQGRQRMGPRDNRGGGGRNMGGPRGNFGSHNGSGDMGMRGSGVGGGPMRRERGFAGGRGAGGVGGGNTTPYNRNSGNQFDRWQGGQKSVSRNYDMDNAPMGYNNGPQVGLGSDRYGGGAVGGNFGMGNQDRRGFALPDRPLYSNDMGPTQSRGPMMGGNPRGSGGGGGMRGNNQGFDRRQGGGGFNDNADMFTRRGGGGNMGINNGGGGGGGGRGSFNRNSMPGRGGGGGGGGNDNYNQVFPPLGGGGANRNGPRRDMMSNRRY